MLKMINEQYVAAPVGQCSVSWILKCLQCFLGYKSFIQFNYELQKTFVQLHNFNLLHILNVTQIRVHP
jgi:hypothetical protein